MIKMSDDNYTKVLKLCRTIIKEEFEPCGLRDLVEDRILELVQEWKRRKTVAEKEGRTIGSLKLIYYDLIRGVNKANSDSKRYGKDKCEYLMRALSLPPTVKGGLGYWTIASWQ